MADRFNALWQIKSGVEVDRRIAEIEADDRLSRQGKDRRIAKLQQDRSELIAGLEAGRGKFSLPVDRKEFTSGRRGI